LAIPQGRLLHTLQALGDAEQAAELMGKLPGAGMFALFCQEQSSSGDRFRFDREADGTPRKAMGLGRSGVMP